ncbi:hypothetical protein [Clostridium sp. JN-1]|uniref:hypothetical protein n=1 Tax=Clostridium sp. JN-1 TaxID=2483110 RepID=UPI000F0AF9D7|nr:hypothetical protein [Clostridium sp. JN-1]
MSDRKIMEDYCTDICNLVDILNKLTNSYRLLIGGAGELNSIGLARKNQIRDAIDRAVDLGNIIDKVMKSLDKSSCAYFDYCELKCKFLNNKVIEAYVLTEINEELQLKNQVNNKPEGNNEKKEGSSS